MVIMRCSQLRLKKITAERLLAMLEFPLSSIRNQAEKLRYLLDYLPSKETLWAADSMLANLTRQIDSGEIVAGQNTRESASVVVLEFSDPITTWFNLMALLGIVIDEEISYSNKILFESIASLSPKGKARVARLDLSDYRKVMVVGDSVSGLVPRPAGFEVISLFIASQRSLAVMSEELPIPLRGLRVGVSEATIPQLNLDSQGIFVSGIIDHH